MKATVARHLTVRNVPEEVVRALDRERRRDGKSLNRTVIDVISRGLGIGGERPENGLRRLAGTWTAEELAAFEAAMADLEHVDDELWK